MIATALTGALAAGLSGCGGGGDGGGSGAGKGDNKSSASSGDPRKSAPSAGGGSDTTSPAQVLAQIKGAHDISVTLNSAVRDPDGFVTVQGTLTNDGTGTFDADAWRGNEVALAQSGASAAGAVLVDEAGKKRYYVLRDTDGKCLCTMGLTGVKPNETRPFFAQFPSPPAATTEVEFELPTMPPAKITISEG